MCFSGYYHYLIRLRNREPVSLSYVDVDTTQLRLLMKNHQDYGQILCLYNSDGELLYSSSEDIRNQEEKEKKQLFGLHSDVENVNIGGISYLALRRTSEETGIVLLSLLPKSAWVTRGKGLFASSGNADCSDHYLSDHYCYAHDPDDHNSIEEAVLPDGKNG